MNPVTILLPTLRFDDYFYQTLETVLRVDYPNFNVLVIHDSQIDHTDDLRGLDRKAEMHEIGLTIVHSPIGGLVSALNYGLSITENEYICRIDADDLIVPSRLRLQTEYLDANPNVAVVGGQLQFMKSDGRVTNNRSNYPIGPVETRSKLQEGCFIAHPSVMFRKSAVLSVGGYRSFFKSAEDYDLWLRILDYYDISNIEDVVTIYRQHSAQMSANLKDVDLYTRAALHSRKLRSLGNIADLPILGVDIEAWIHSHQLEHDQSWSMGKFINRKVLFGNYLILKIKYMKSRRRFAQLFLLLLLAFASSPILMCREIRKFAQKKLKSS